MKGLLRRRPSPALVIACIALFVSLGPAAYATHKGFLALAHPNTSTAQTSLSGAVAGGKVLQLTNTSTLAGAEGLGITVGANKAPIHVNSTAGKATFLNSDKLDGLDSGSFVQGAAGRAMYVRQTVVDNNTNQTLLTIPGFVSLEGNCTALGAPGGRAYPIIRNLDSTRTIDVATTTGGFFTLGAGASTAVRSIDANGAMETIQVGQTYRLTAGGFPRTRMVTFFLSARYDVSCPFQVQALAQGF